MTGAITNHLWQSTVFAVAVGLAALALRNNAARLRHVLWLMASVKFLLPFGLLVNAGSEIEWPSGTALAPSPEVVSTLVQVSEPFSSTPSAQWPQQYDWLRTVMVAVWACGAAGLVCIRVRGWLRIRSIVRSSRPVDTPLPIRVRSCPELLEPGVVGLWRGVLLLPADLQQRLTADQMEAVLAHELCHIKRRDNATSAIHMLVETVFWFYPLVWWIGTRLIEERERACDEAVLDLGNDSRAYAEAILRVCQSYFESPLMSVSGVAGSDIKKRLEHILSSRAVAQLSIGKKIALAAVGIAAVVLPLVVGVLEAQTSGATSRPRFDAASVRICKSADMVNRRAGAVPPSPGRLNTGCMALAEEDHTGLIQRAYVRFASVPFDALIVPIKGGPDWMRKERFDINAVAEGASTPRLMQGPMLQTLLENRFKLKVSRRATPGPVYELRVKGDRVKLKPFLEGTCVPVVLNAPPTPTTAGERRCNAAVRFAMEGRLPRVDGEGATLDEFSRLLNFALDRPVVNKTGLEGRFDMSVEFSASGASAKLNAPPGVAGQAGPETDDPNAPGIFTAIKEQLGLELVPATGNREYLLIEHVERPSAN